MTATSDAVDRFHRTDRWMRRVGGIVALVTVLVLTVVAVVSFITLRRVLEVTDPHGRYARQAAQNQTQVVDELANRFDQISQQRLREAIEAIRTGKPPVFNPLPRPAPPLPPVTPIRPTSTTTTTVPPPGTTAPKA